MTSVDSLIGISLLFAPWLFGAVLGWHWAATLRGVAVAIGVGLVAIAGVLAVFLLTSPGSAEAACGEDECLQYFGRWLDASVAREWLPYAMAVWSFCAIGFACLRRSRGPKRRSAGFERRLLRLFGPESLIWRLAFFAAMLLLLLFESSVLPEGPATFAVYLVTLSLAALGLITGSLISVVRRGSTFLRRNAAE